ncbi:MAG TPA: apolipoprotein N-acyltransferase [Casimicrobiaceae bacterium]|nr:apolipoprotein N-acyltransferase [Casimicrobiaceae bacterium]
MTSAEADAATLDSIGARRFAWILSLVAGALTVFGFAPFGWKALPIVTLATLLALWQRASRARDGAGLGFAFGVGLFGAGVSWVYVALETFGGMPAVFAAIGTAGFVAFLSLYPMLAGALVVRFTRAGSATRLLAGASAFVIAEWLRGWVLSGFGWLAIGYSQLPGSPLAWYAPIGGVWLVSLAIALIAACLARTFDALNEARYGTIAMCAFAALAITLTGAALRRIEWTTPAGTPLAVSLVQGNVAQDLKFDRAFRERTYALYTSLAEASRGSLIVLPESTFPMFAQELPQEVIATLARTAKARGGELLFGVFLLEPAVKGSDEPRVYNSVVSVGTNESSLYRKRHLVPFGETIPAKPLVGWVMQHLLSIPVGDQTPGPAEQAPFRVGSERVAVNICYEDAFGNELRGAARNATLLVNVTNDAWYGYSIAARQHNQISAMRALELGRPMLRATNTGITSAIGHDGRVISELPWFTRGVLEVSIAGRRGDTPYLRYGDLVAIGIAAVLLGAAVLLSMRR